MSSDSLAIFMETDEFSFPYIFWDQVEPSSGLFTFDHPENDIATYIKTAQEEGLNVVLRPGPYICGEHDFGFV